MVSADTSLPVSQSSEAESAPPSLLEYPATYLLIGLNVAIYLIMVRLGSPFLFKQPALTSSASGIGGVNVRELTSWLGQILTASFSDRTLALFGSCIPGRIVALGEWWRLLSSIFVHVTLLHLLLNMWCLWNLGLFGEPLLGKAGLIAVYLLTGAAGMLQSVIVNWTAGDHDLVIAGASGAVFGLAGILIILLSNRKLSASWEDLKKLRLQVIFFALANLLIGMLPNLLLRFFPEVLRRLPLRPQDLPQIDNNAHVGGFLFGLALGFLLFPRMTSGRSSYRTRQAIVFSTAALALTLLSYAVAAFARSLAA